MPPVSVALHQYGRKRWIGFGARNVCKQAIYCRGRHLVAFGATSVMVVLFSNNYYREPKEGHHRLP